MDIKLAFDIVLELAESSALDKDQKHWATKELANLQQEAIKQLRDLSTSKTLSRL